MSTIVPDLQIIDSSTSPDSNKEISQKSWIIYGEKENIDGLLKYIGK
jgi:hypothetical protein